MTDTTLQRKNSVELERWLAEIRKAEERLRRFPDQNGRSNPNRPRSAAIRWVLNFARVNLDNLSEGDLTNLRFELQHLSRIEMYLDKGWSVDFARPWPEKEHIVTTQQWLQQAIRAILEGGYLSFVEPERSWSLFYDDKERRWNVSDMVIGDYLKIEMFRLIREHIHHLQKCRCNDCEQLLFLKDRQNQEFCSNRCKWRHAQRHRPDRTIPPERFGKRGRPPGTGPTKGKTNGQKKIKKAAATRRPHSRRVSTKRS
ncbi:MAG: hypothetical protein MRJ68_16330 [Nitrospira sp.]|nr:hypothetical protein [Nitrospira sp.]